jgi:hypothetical protein
MQQSIDQGGRCPDHHLRDKLAVAVTEQHAQFGLADAKRILQYCVEDRLEPAGRARDDAQHLGACRLLLHGLGKVLPRLGQLAGARFELLFQLDQ